MVTNDLTISEIDNADPTIHDKGVGEAMSVCQQKLNEWPGKFVSINYSDKTTNTQSEVMAKLITAEAGVNLNPQK